MNKVKKYKTYFIISIIVAVIIYIAYFLMHYVFYDGHKKYLKEYSMEAGSEYKPIKESKSFIEGMELAAENDYLKLYTNTETTEIAVYDKKGDKIYYSNPVDRAEDTVATGINKTALNSQFMITYYDKSMTESSMYNYDYSVERNQFKIEAIENGIRYVYVLGNLGSSTGIVPPIISIERLEELVLSKLSEKDAKTVRLGYLDMKDKEGFLELSKGVQGNKIKMSKIIKLFEEVDYSFEDLEQEAILAEGSGKGSDKTSFTIPLEYRLVDDKLQVSIPTHEIVETGNEKLGGIELLSFFGAGSTEDEGYMLVPNGSGSLINFNNGKKVERYNQYIYGMDETQQSFTVVENTLKARLPVFGIKKGSSALFAEIIEGDALANLISYCSGISNSYNVVYPAFTIRGTGKASMFGSTGMSADLPTLEKDIYKLDIKINYSFLADEDATYSGMASHYRDELVSRGVLSKKEASNSIPFYLDIVGGVKKQVSFLGIPYLSVYPMTTFKEAGIMVDEFVDNGVSNIRLNYLGWFNGGYYHNTTKKVKVDKKVGSKKALSKLNNKLKETNSILYGDVALQKVSFVAKNYNYKMESSQYYAGYTVSLGRVNPATLRQTGGLGYFETNFNILSPKFLERYVSKLNKGLRKVDLSGVSLRDLGNTLTSDKKRSKVISRQEAKDIVLAQLEDLATKQENLLINNPNAYAFQYATDITDAPSSHNKFHIVDQEVPFYQMVIHGHIDYTSAAINLSDTYNKRDSILKMIEYGISPRFTLSYKESSEIKYSGLNSLYSTQYKLWLEDAVSMYEEINSVLKNVTNSSIIEHIELEEGIKKVTYDNGCIIYINSTNEDVNVDGLNISAKNYALEGVME